MPCNGFIENTNVIQRLKEVTSSNSTLFASYISVIQTYNGFNRDFSIKLKDKTGIDINDVPDNKVDEVVNFIKEYYNAIRFDVHLTSTEDNSKNASTRFGYNSIADRDFAKRIVANYLLDTYHQLNNDLHEKVDKDKKLSYYADIVLYQIEKHLIDRIAAKTNLDEDSIYDILDDMSRLDEVLGNDGNIQNANILALYKELKNFDEDTESYNSEFFEEVFLDSRLGDIRLADDHANAEQVEYENKEEGEEPAQDDQDSDDPGSKTEDDKNHTIGTLADKSGLTKNYMTHVGMSIRSFLGSLKKIYNNQNVSSKDGYEYDTDNALGIPDVMDAEACCAVLYGYGDYTNTTTMIKSIRDIANRMHGFAALHQLADYCEENSDFAYLLYTSFGKTIISKMETIVTEDGTVTRPSNRTADTNTALRFEYINSVTTTAVQIDDVHAASLKKAIDDKIKEIKDILQAIKDGNLPERRMQQLKDSKDILVKEVKAELFERLSKYYPTLDEYSISYYIESANDKDIVGNISKLADILEDTIEGSKSTYQSYISKQAQINSLWAKQQAAKKDKNKGKEDGEEYSDEINDLYAESYLSKKSTNAAIDLANEMTGYAPVKIELNSRNVHGNQSSDVINNCFLTNIINTLKTPEALNNFGKYRFQARQYDFSNIMVEHWEYEKDDKGNYVLDENGEPKPIGKTPINYGLFRQHPITGEFTPTEYANQLLKIRLFSGATDAVTSTSALYAEMSKGDYVATAFINFFNTEEDYNNSDNLSAHFANYFMRIPSDAPKNFIIRAPKYDIRESKKWENDGLFQFTDVKAVKKAIREKISQLPVIDQLDFAEKYSTNQKVQKENDKTVVKEKFPISTREQLVERATSTDLDNIRIYPNQINEARVKNGDVVTVTYDYLTDGVHNIYVMQGTLNTDNGRMMLQNPKFLGFEDAAHSSDVNADIEDIMLQRMIANREVVRQVNKNHPVYKQLRQVFIQELTNAANTLDMFFETENGLVKRDSEGNPIFKPGYANDKATARTLYEIYHVGKGKTIIEKEGEIEHLTGKVFTSDRFVLTTEDENGNVVVRNYGNEIIDEAISFLYGGAKNGEGSYLHTKVNSQGNIEVVLTEKQEEVLNEKLSEFILDYVEDAKERMDSFKEFIPAELYSDTNIEDFAINHHLAYIGFNDLFEGDTKFYKDSQTFLKRAKEVQASGVPYGIANYNMDLSEGLNPVASRLDKLNLKQKTADGREIDFKVGLRSKFVGVTVANTVRTNPDTNVEGVAKAKEDGNITKQLAKAIENSGVDPKIALERARDMMGGIERDGDHGYHGTTVNDAQSYITFKEWIRRITARGQLGEYLPLIEAILDETKEIDAVLLDKFVQVQKNFYFDINYNDRLKTSAPRQIKNAEFVLIPRFIRGTQLEQVHELMETYGIDQLNTAETSKAGKAYTLTLWNENEDLTDENIQDFKDHVNDAKELYNYNYLYTQQETPQHINSNNKAGIQIVKKILDNISEGSPLYKHKERFFKLYCANIKESNIDLLDELAVEHDEDGNIITDDEGNIQGLNYDLLFDMFKQEVIRQGLDSNTVDYVTLNKEQSVENSNQGVRPTTVMPNYMSYLGPKLENIAQSLFNSRITRQLLPGFHAAQITGVGFKARTDVITYELLGQNKGKSFNGVVLKDGISEEEYKALDKTLQTKYIKRKGNIATSKTLRYHPDGENHIEVMLPASNFGLKRYTPEGRRKSDEELLQELRDGELDTFIGYRIPTEGKQSVAVMKVVGFTDDSLGSTIVVPDDWVSQTGSDFDIDSVYGIHYTGRIDKKTGKIKRIKYNEEPTIYDYLNYVLHKLDRKKDKKVKAKVEELRNDFRNREEIYDSAFSKEGELYHALPEEVRNKIKELQAPRREYNEDEKYQKYIDQHNQVIEGLESYVKSDNIGDEERIAINNYIEGRKELKKATEISDVDSKLKELGIPTFTEYKNIPAEERNSRAARNNEILSSMIAILSDDRSLEENLSRSNFEDIVRNRNKNMSNNVSIRRKNRSPFNFLDQADYQEDTMSGAKLKAFSVTRDTYCSICNTIKPTVDKQHQVKVVYRKADGYVLEELQKSFDNVEVIDNGNAFIVTHDTFGWTKNNRNTVGKLLTAYSSQTTAHILDSVKEGPIPNVNDFTFQVYKLFPDIGSDYETGVSFMMQDGVRAIVEEYEKNKSIYSHESSKPINAAIKKIARQILALDGDRSINRYTSMDEVITKLQSYNGALGRLFGANSQNYKISTDDSESAKLLISAARLNDRLQNKGVFKGDSIEAKRNRLLFDLGVVFQYNKLSHLGDAVMRYARVSNPDKFGAKQSIYETRQIFNEIKTIREEEEENGSVLTAVSPNSGEQVNILEAVYPGINKYSTVDDIIKSNNIKDSVYPSLYSFLKYATVASVKINTQLFITEDERFVEQLISLKDEFSGTKRKLSKKHYNDFKNYVLNNLYNQTSAIALQVLYVPGKGFALNPDTDKEAERRRIYGYGKTPDLKVPVVSINSTSNEGPFNDMVVSDDMVDFIVKDINNPTAEEIYQFSTLSPAQKVDWIQANSRDAGIFKYIRTTTFNSRARQGNRAGSQTIQFIEGNANIESIYKEFTSCFYNSNPLIAMAAFDIIKYAFAVEGFRMRRNGVSKIIKNKVLLDTSFNGTGFVNNMSHLINNIFATDIESIKQNYIRSHSGMSEIETHRVDKVNKIPELPRIGEHVIYLDITSNNEHKRLANKYGFTYEVGTKGSFGVNKYVKLNFDKKTVLYKIVANNEDAPTQLAAYPLNILEANEDSKWSVNAVNNTYLNEDFYKGMISELFNAISHTERKEIIEKHKENRDNFKYKKPKESTREYALPFDINEKGTVHTGGFENVIDKVIKHYSNNPTTSLYVRSLALNDFISKVGQTSIQNINGIDYVITKVDFTKYNDYYIGHHQPNFRPDAVDPQVKEIMEKAQADGHRVNNAFVISPYIAPVETNTKRKSSVTESRRNPTAQLGVNSVNNMKRNRANSNNKNLQEASTSALDRLDSKGIKPNSESVLANTHEIIATTAQYVNTAVASIMNDLKYFFKTEDGIWHAIDEPVTIDHIRNNPDERKRFLETIVEARAFAKDYAIIDAINITSADQEIRDALEKIRKDINELDTATIINSAEMLFADDYLAKISNNPLVKRGIIGLRDGFYTTSYLNAWINDLQETTNPLLQIITAEVMGDIRAKELAGKEYLRQFRAEVARIKEEAKTKGENINWDNIIDEYGKFIQQYDPSFSIRIQELRAERDKYKYDVSYGEGSIEYLKAKWEYDKFKLNHVNQVLIDDYYHAKLALEKDMIDNHSLIYSTYKKLEARRTAILGFIRGGVLEESKQKELNEINEEITNLTSDYYSLGGQLHSKYDYEDPSNPLTGEARKLYSSNEANAIQHFLKEMKHLNDQYYTYDASFGFEDELEKNLRIVRREERRTAKSGGKLGVSQEQLMENEEYVKAKMWLAINARFVVTPEIQKLVNEAFTTLHEAKQGRRLLSDIAKRKNLYDENGVIDATKLTEEDIDKIRKQELANYNTNESQPYNDRSLISNAPEDDTVFNSKFYQNMKPNGIDNPEYVKIVNEINTILKPYYDPVAKQVYTSELSEDDIEKLIELYGKLGETKKTVNSTNGRKIYKYVKRNVDFVTNDAAYERERNKVENSNKSERYKRLWYQLNEVLEEDENTSEVVPNRYLYGYAVPKGYKPDGTGDNSMVSPAKTKALRTLKQYTRNDLTVYYYQKYEEMYKKSEKEFNEWYQANHFYNPYTHQMQPLQCWTKLTILEQNDDGEYEVAGLYVPAFSQQERRPKDGRMIKNRAGQQEQEDKYTNDDYIKDGSTEQNYKAKGPVFTDHYKTSAGRTINDYSDNTSYENSLKLNSSEIAMKKLFETTLKELAKSDSAKRFIRRGYMAARRKGQEIDAKFIAKESAKLLGWIEGSSGRESWYHEVDYANDRTPEMPMLSVLSSQDSLRPSIKRPERTPEMTEDEYNKKMKEYEKHKKEVEETNAKIHKDLLDRDWESVMEDFINKAFHFNAVQENKFMLFYAKNMIDKLENYVQNLGFNELQKEGGENGKYITKQDSRLQDQFANWIRRIVYEQWKEPNARYTRVANILQSLTSAKFMMLNVSGGVANITVGHVQILGEIFAKDYFGGKAWKKAISFYNSGIPSYLADMYKETSSSLASAIIKFMNVVDFDELNGVVRIPDAQERIKRLRDLAFSPNAMGEHMMQNGAMFALMESHRLYANRDKEKNGRLSYEYKNIAEVTRDAHEEALLELIKDDETLKAKWEAFKKYQTESPDNVKDYAWFKADMTTDFVRLYLKDRIKEFNERKNALETQAKEEFNDNTAHPTLMSQFELGKDGMLSFKDGSILKLVGDEAYDVLGRFKGRVISINKKIHGNYDKLSAAKLESQWWGGLVMQYHKHIFPGVMKRYRRRGYFNEERGSIEKGAYAALKDFLSIPLRDNKLRKKLQQDSGITVAELQVMEGTQNLFRAYTDFLTHIMLNYHAMPEHEQANIRRAMADLCGMLSALCLAVALCAFGDDDDFGYNFFMNQADRLASESMMYTPVGLYLEGKKLWSSPVAVQGAISDAVSTMGLIGQYFIQGDEFEPYYTSGLFAGENKLWVKLRRNIPMYHSVDMLQRLTKNNKYYKLGSNILGVIPADELAEWIFD